MHLTYAYCNQKINKSTKISDMVLSPSTLKGGPKISNRNQDTGGVRVEWRNSELEWATVRTRGRPKRLKIIVHQLQNRQIKLLRYFAGRGTLSPFVGDVHSRSISHLRTPIVVNIHISDYDYAVAVNMPGGMLLDDRCEFCEKVCEVWSAFGATSCVQLLNRF